MKQLSQLGQRFISLLVYTFFLLAFPTSSAWAAESFQCEGLGLLSTTSGVTHGYKSGVQASRGWYCELQSGAVGDAVVYEVFVEADGLYDIKLTSRRALNLGIVQLYIDGTPHGSPMDQYRATATFDEFELGSFPLTRGLHQFELRVSGKHADSSGYFATLDKLVLISTTSGWQMRTIQATSVPGPAPAPPSLGADGLSVDYFNNDKLPDVFVNFEAGDISRLYLHPGYANVDLPWPTYIEFPYGGEDSGVCDLDMDSFPDLIIDGQHVYFHPGHGVDITDVSNWDYMHLGTSYRLPFCHDVDDDGHRDLLVGGEYWYRAPASGKRIAANWDTVYDIDDTSAGQGWPMSGFIYDVDKDGEDDIVINWRLQTVWYKRPPNPHLPWDKHIVFTSFDPIPPKSFRFMKIADVDGDGTDDFVIANTDTDNGIKHVNFLRRKTNRGDFTYSNIAIDMASEFPLSFPKGIEVYDYDDNGRTDIFVLNKANAYILEYSATPLYTPNWVVNDLGYSASKYDDAFNFDIDNDGDMDVLTTEEVDGDGVIWFENPLY